MSSTSSEQSAPASSRRERADLPPAAAVASFDVFDTVITRAVTSAQSLFLLLGRRLVARNRLHVSPPVFARARTDAERRAASIKAGPPTLDEIYGELGHGLAVSDEDAARLREAELDLERELIRPVPAGRALVEEARAAGKRLVFVSDMYLPTGCIAQYLNEHGLSNDDGMYISGDRGRTKTSGDLFKLMLADEAVAARDVTHSGNDLRGDLRTPQKLGLATQPLLAANLNRYEEVLDSHAIATDGLTAALGGAARLARLYVPLGDCDEALRDVAASVGGPMLVAYVLWVLNTAQRREIEHLFFLSRDGQILLEIAQRLAPKIGYTGQLEYLHCSRRAINFAAFGADLSGEMRWLWTPQSSPTCEALLAQVDLQPEEIETDLVKLGLSPETWLRPLDEGERQRLVAFLLGPFRRHLEQRHVERRSLILDYLDSSGVLQEAAIGIVDLGGAGSQYRALHRLRDHAGRSRPTGFLAHLDPPPAIDRHGARRLVSDDLHAWFNDQRRHLGFPRLRGIAAAMLMFSQADHGTVLSYRRRGGRVEPVLAPTTRPQAVGPEFRLVRGAILRVAEEVILADELVDRHVDVRRAIDEILRLFWNHPSRAEAEAWQWLELEESPRPDQDVGDRLTRAYSVRDAVYLVRHRAWPGPWYEWPKGSMEISPPLIRGVLKVMLWIRRRITRSQREGSKTRD